MSFLGKLKSLHSAPAAPCRRTDEEFGWPQDEFDDDDDDDDGDGDRYEMPPCEPAVKVRERPVENNVYLDKQSSPTALQRQTVPAPRAYKLPVTKHKTQQCGPLFFDTNPRKPPEIDRKEKPGRKAQMFSRAASLPPSTEEDVYIDPNGEQENSDGLYLEPIEAYPLTSPRTMRMSFPPKTSLKSPPICIMKPPLPRPMPNSFLPSMAESKRDHSVRIKLPTPIPSVRTSLLANLKEASQSSSNPPLANSALVASLREHCENQFFKPEDNEWFAGDINRKSAEILLLKINKDGAYLIRHSSAKSTRQPFTLAVLYQQKVYNVPIRFLEDTQGYALGKEGKTNEEVFSSLEEMISHHQKNQLLLIDSKTQAKQTAYLSHPVRP